jgi:hypothetical protein
VKRFGLLSIVCLSIVLSLTMFVSAKESATDLSHQAHVWNAKTEFWRLWEANQRLDASLAHQGKIWDAKVDYWQ